MLPSPKMWWTLGQKRGHALTKILTHIGTDNQVLSQSILADGTPMMLQTPNGLFGDLEGQGSMPRYFLSYLANLPAKLVNLENFIDQAELQSLLGSGQSGTKHEFLCLRRAYGVNDTGMDSHAQAVSQGAGNGKPYPTLRGTVAQVAHQSQSGPGPDSNALNSGNNRLFDAFEATDKPLEFTFIFNRV